VTINESGESPTPRTTAADAQIDVEQQSDNPDPENDFNPATGATHS